MPESVKRLSGDVTIYLIEFSAYTRGPSDLIWALDALAPMRQAFPLLIEFGNMPERDTS